MTIQPLSKCCKAPVPYMFNRETNSPFQACEFCGKRWDVQEGKTYVDYDNIPLSSCCKAPVKVETTTNTGRTFETILPVCTSCGKSCVVVEDNYEHHSHIHCFDQKGTPPCGIPLHKHTQCCLCDIKYPINASTVEDLRKEFYLFLEQLEMMKIANAKQLIFDWFLTHASTSDSTLREVLEEVGEDCEINRWELENGSVAENMNCAMNAERQRIRAIITKRLEKKI